MLKDEDGQEIVVDGIGAVRNEGQFEIGRPPGIKAGSDLNAVMVFKFGGLLLVPGGYVWELQVGTTMEVASQSPGEITET